MQINVKCIILTGTDFNPKSDPRPRAIFQRTGLRDIVGNRKRQALQSVLQRGDNSSHHHSCHDRAAEETGSRVQRCDQNTFPN